jgi:peptide/nickel transport system permease protein
MVIYVLRRLALGLVLVLGVATVAFFVIHLVPGDPGRTVLGPRASPGAVAALNDRLGLDEPLLTQYWLFLRGAVTLDFGTSITYNVPVGSLLGSRIVPTALLIVYGIVLALLIAIPMAILAAVHRDRAADHGIRLVGMVTFAMPPFWTGLVLVLVFALQLGLFPTSGYRTSPVDALWSLTLPAITISLFVAHLVLRTLRASLIGTLSSDFVEAARARGFSERRVLYRHALRNSFVSALTIIGVLVAVLISTSVLIENVFAIPGLGQLLVEAVQGRDYPVVQALTVLMGTAVVLVNIVIDVGYAFVDPRVRL